VQPTRIAVPEVELSMLFLQIATFLKGTREDDLERIFSVFEVLFDRHPVGDELVVGSRVW
jgi:hypothetical protein